MCHCQNSGERSCGNQFLLLIGVAAIPVQDYQLSQNFRGFFSIQFSQLRPNYHIISEEQYTIP